MKLFRMLGWWSLAFVLLAPVMSAQEADEEPTVTGVEATRPGGGYMERVPQAQEIGDEEVA
ncbi:MAG: hypothetical protein J6386_09970 [Candidatus Synoicihabitans palmerolidicus]|nr:hypothetical protein [Candidatus Synoicihabitans palmerolidicus]